MDEDIQAAAGASARKAIEKKVDILSPLLNHALVGYSQVRLLTSLALVTGSINLG